MVTKAWLDIQPAYMLLCLCLRLLDVDDAIAASHPEHIKDALKTLNNFNKRI